MSAKRVAIEFEGVRLTSPDKVLYPDLGVTKRALAEYYREVHEHMLPHVARRPLTLVRCPDGAAGECFFQKHVGKAVPKSVASIVIAERKKRDTYMVVHDLPGLIGLVQVNALEIHEWGSRQDDVEKPDRIVFDLDPAPDLDFDAVMHAARDVRDRLKRDGFTSFPMTTGGKGLHVVVPIERRHGWEEVASFARTLAERMSEDEPTRYLSEASKAKRTGRIFVDWLRNRRGQTAICPYSTRKHATATVATPLAWTELRKGLVGARHTVATIPSRLEALAKKRRDPWEGYGELRQRL